MSEKKAPSAQAARLAEVRRRLRDTMWDDVGIVRWDRGLARACEVTAAILAGEEARWPPSRWTAEAVELRNLAQAADLIARSARSRKESRGLHFNADHPESDDARFGGDTVLGG